eukprot:2060306-Rhodomonas_salina.1
MIGLAKDGSLESRRRSAAAVDACAARVVSLFADPDQRCWRCGDNWRRRGVFGANADGLGGISGRSDG